MSEHNFIAACLDSGGICLRKKPRHGNMGHLARRTPVACVVSKELRALVLKQRAYVPARRVGWLDNMNVFTAYVWYL